MAVSGIYFTDHAVCEIAKTLKESKRGELEIADLLNIYIERSQLEVEILHRGIGWMDAGTIKSLSEASELVRVLQERQGLMVGCIEEIAFQNEWINSEKVLYFADKYKKNSYGKYLSKIANQETN